MDIIIKILLIVFFVWLVGVFFGWFQSFSGPPRNPLLLLLAILLAFLILREFGLFRRGRLLCYLSAPTLELLTDERTGAEARRPPIPKGDEFPRPAPAA